MVDSSGNTTENFLSPPYSPWEMNGSVDRQGYYTDIYMAAAVLYELISGGKIPLAADRMGADPYVPLESWVYSHISPAMLSAVNQALSFNPEQRPQTVKEWKELMNRPDAPVAARDTSSLPPLLPGETPPLSKGLEACGNILLNIVAMCSMALILFFWSEILQWKNPFELQTSEWWSINALFPLSYIPTAGILLYISLKFRPGGFFGFFLLGVIFGLLMEALILCWVPMSDLTGMEPDYHLAPPILLKAVAPELSWYSLVTCFLGIYGCVYALSRSSPWVMMAMSTLMGCFWGIVAHDSWLSESDTLQAGKEFFLISGACSIVLLLSWMALRWVYRRNIFKPSGTLLVICLAAYHYLIFANNFDLIRTSSVLLSLSTPLIIVILSFLKHSAKASPLQKIRWSPSEVRLTHILFFLWVPFVATILNVLINDIEVDWVDFWYMLTEPVAGILLIISLVLALIPGNLSRQRNKLPQ
jgi:hypothetical protein